MQCLRLCQEEVRLPEKGDHAWQLLGVLVAATMHEACSRLTNTEVDRSNLEGYISNAS